MNPELLPSLFKYLVSVLLSVAFRWSSPIGELSDEPIWISFVFYVNNS